MAPHYREPLCNMGERNLLLALFDFGADANLTLFEFPYEDTLGKHFAFDPVHTILDTELNSITASFKVSGNDWTSGTFLGIYPIEHLLSFVVGFSYIHI